MTDSDIDHRDSEAASAWRSRLGTFALLILGLVAFEISASPSLGVAIACLKFGWDDARDGAWLCRVDPNRQRGWACLWIYLGVGFLKASLIAFLGAVTMAIFAYNFGITLGWPRRLLAGQLLGALAVGLLGVALATFASLVATFLAWRTGVKLWVGPETRRAYNRGVWPPSTEPGFISRKNRAGSALVVTIASVMFFVVSMSIGFLIAKFPILRQAVHEAEILGGLVIVLVLPIGSAVFMLALRDFLKNHVIARHPAECWPEAFETSIHTPMAYGITTQNG